MHVRIKVMPTDTPNAPGEWHDVPLEWLRANPRPRVMERWDDVADFFAPLVPEGFVLVEVESGAWRS